MIEPTKNKALNLYPMLVVLLALGFVYIAWLYLPLSDSTKSDASVFKQRTVYYSLTVQNKSAELVKDSELKVFAPVKQTAYQRAGAMKASIPFKLLNDARGNQTLQFALTVPPYASKVVSIEAQVQFSIVPISSELDHAEIYLGTEKNLEVDNPAIKDLARSIKAETIREGAQKALDWISSNIKDQGYVREDRGALFAFERKLGDCTEFSNLFAALMRSNGIPARVLGGFVLRDSSRLQGRSYHNWVEYYDGKSWELSDPFNKVLGFNGEDYVALRILSGSDNSDFSDSQRFLAFDPRLEISLN